MGVFCISGVKVTCPKCGVHIATVLNDLYCGTPIQKHDFKFEDNHYPHDGLISCNMCGTLYVQYGKLHTECGWIGGDMKLDYKIGINELVQEITMVR